MFDALPLDYHQPESASHLPLILDSFAGGGGASTGIEMALGRSPDVAINHGEVALSMHAANHPDTEHLITSIYKVDPRDLVTLTTRDRFGVVTVNIQGQTYAITDIGMRMLTPREQFRAQGFEDSYIIDRGADGRAMPKTHQTQKCGNSVCPPVAAALVSANCAHLKETL